MKQSLSARLRFLSSVDPISSFPPFPIPSEFNSSVFLSSDCSNTRNCRLFLSTHLDKARNVVQTVLSSIEGSDTSKLAAEIDDVVRSQRVVLEEISSATDSLNAVWSQYVDKSTGALTRVCFAANYADAVTKNASFLLQLLNKHIAWVQTISDTIQNLHDSQFSRIFLEFIQTNHPNSKESYSELYTLLRDVDVLVSDKINPNGALFLEVRQWCIHQVTALWRVYVRDSGLSLEHSSPERFVGEVKHSHSFWNRQRAIPVLSPSAWASGNVTDDIGLESCETRPNSLKEFIFNKQVGLSFLMKEIDSKLEYFEQQMKQKMKLSSEIANLGEVLSRILAAKSVVKSAIKVLTSAEEDPFHQKFETKFFKLFEETKLSTRKLILKFQKHFSLESSQRINVTFDSLAWVYKHSPLLSESFLHFLQEKGASVTHSSADCCHMLLLDVDLSFALACIPNFQAFFELRQSVCNSFLSDYLVFVDDLLVDPANLLVNSQFHCRCVSPYFKSIVCALPDFPFKYSERCVQSLLCAADTIMDKSFFDRQRDEFIDNISDSVHRLCLLIKRHPVKDSDFKFLKLLQNLPNFSGLYQNKLKAVARKIDRYGSAYVEFNKELLASTHGLQSRIESRDNGLIKAEKVLEKAGDYFQSLTKLFLKLCKAGNGLRKMPSLLEFCANFVNFSMYSSPDGILSALLQLYRAESRLSMSLSPNLDSVIPFVLAAQEAGFVLKVGSEWFYPSHTRSLQLTGWSETRDADVPFMASPFFSEAAPYFTVSQRERDSLIFFVTETARRFCAHFKKLGLTNSDVLTNKLRQSASSVGQKIKDFSAANLLLDQSCAEILTNSLKEYTATIASQIFDVSPHSIKRYVTEVHEALQALYQSLLSLQDLQFSRTFLRITKDASKSFWRSMSTDNSSVTAFVKLRDLFNVLHACDVKISEIINPDGCNYLNSMEWFGRKLGSVEDYTSLLSPDLIDSLNSLRASESSVIQYWMREYAIQTIDPVAFDDVHWNPDQEQICTRLVIPRAANELFEALLVDSKRGISELVHIAESSVKESCDCIEAQFPGYSSIKTAKSKDIPRSGPLFDEFSAVNEVVLALESDLKKLKPAIESVLETFIKIQSILKSFEQKTEGAFSRIEEQLSSISTRWEAKWNDAFKKYCKSMDVASIHNDRLQMSQIFVDWWRVVGRSDALPIANSLLRILRCFDNDVIAFFRPATKPLLDVRRHLISLRCRSECDSSSIEECIFNMSEVLPVDKFIWPTQVSTQLSALFTFDRSQVMESRFSDARVVSFLRELRLRMTNIKAALENARIL